MFGTIKIRKSDKLWREYLLKKRGCRSDYSGIYFPEGKGLQVSHFYSRQANSVRYSEDNCDLLSIGEHLNFHKNPTEYVDWKMKKLGEKKYKELLLAKNTLMKKDEVGMCIAIKKLIELEK